MQDRSIPIATLLTETLRLLARLLLVVLAFGLVVAILYFFGWTGLQAELFATFFAMVFFSAPLASSVLRARRGLPLLSSAGRKSLVYCFLWGSLAVAGFVAALQLLQGMGATLLNYAVAMTAGGLLCALTAAISARR